MLSSTPDLSVKSIQVRQDSIFLSRYLSMESSPSDSSVDDYYTGASVRVPFMWEAQPGTPRVKLHERSLPPLTPPPSFHSKSARNKPRKRFRKPNFFNTILSRLNLRKTARLVSPVSSLSLSPWASSSRRSVPSPVIFMGGFTSEAQDSSDSRAYE